MGIYLYQKNIVSHNIMNTFLFDRILDTQIPFPYN